MEGFNLDNILDEGGFSLFSEKDLNVEESSENDDEQEDSTKQNEVDINNDDLVDESSLEDDVENTDEEDAFDIDNDEDDSPDNDFFSSIALSLSEEGILPDLDEETIASIKTPQDLRNAINELIANEIGEVNRRIAVALTNGVPANVVKDYEETLQFLTNISPELLGAEDDQAKKLRLTIIFQDLINRGYSQEKAQKEVDKSFNAGTDIEDAGEALQANIQFYSDSYNSILNNASEVRKLQNENAKRAILEFGSNILDPDTVFFGELSPSKSTRKKILDNIIKPQYKDENTGDYLTSVQKYEREHPQEFRTAIAVLYTLTDGFKSLDGLVDNRAKKEIKKGFRNLESKINNSSRDSFGNLRFASGTDDEDTYIGKGFKFDF